MKTRPVARRVWVQMDAIAPSAGPIVIIPILYPILYRSAQVTDILLPRWH